MKHIPLITILFFILFLFINYELFSFYGANSIHLTVSTYLKPSMFLYIVCEIMILYVLSITIVQRRGFLYKALRFIGNYTYGAYLAHFFFLRLCTKFLSLFALQENTILYSLLLFIYNGHNLYFSNGHWQHTTISYVDYRAFPYDKYEMGEDCHSEKS